MRFLEETFVPLAAKIGTQKHLKVIRDSFMITMPLTIAGAIAVLINNFAQVFNENGLDVPAIYNGWTNFIKLTGLQDVCNFINKGTVATLALLIIISIAYYLAIENKGSGIATACVALSIYCGVAIRDVGLLNEILDAKGLFVAMIIGLITGEIFPRLANNQRLRIAMPEGVPPAVSEAFSNLIPAIITVFIMTSVSNIIMQLTGMTIWDLVTKFVSAPLSNVADSVFTTIIENLFVSILWMFGIHGASIANSITQPVLYPLLQENMIAYTNAENLPYTVVHLFRNVYGQVGGSGATFGFLIASFLFSKSKSERAIAKIALPCGIFQINEPITFGIPIVMNPVYAIPFVVGPALLCAISYFLVKTSIIGGICIEIPWVTPPIINAFLATGGNVMSAVWSAIELVILTILWAPFVMISSRVEANKSK